ncbi:hypothetical protein [Hyphomicrobium sp.]|uniref:hypothetical protein n=1 Tax=Hyphomicrobium sp. TaxID=82 RepID=UPI0025C52A08|nr:hypothetical protein [Hyphomicrobium sp.]
MRSSRRGGNSCTRNGHVAVSRERRLVAGLNGGHDASDYERSERRPHCANTYVAPLRDPL